MILTCHFFFYSIPKVAHDYSGGKKQLLSHMSDESLVWFPKGKVEIQHALYRETVHLSNLRCDPISPPKLNRPSSLILSIEMQVRVAKLASNLEHVQHEYQLRSNSKAKTILTCLKCRRSNLTPTALS